MKLFMLVVLATFLLAACSKTVDDHAAIVIEVAPQQVACTGITHQRCFKVRANKNKPWHLYYGKIKGFTYEPGFLYRLKVRQRHEKPENTDRSGLAWMLVKQLSRQPVTVMKEQSAVKAVTTGQGE